MVDHRICGSFCCAVLCVSVQQVANDGVVERIQ